VSLDRLDQFSISRTQLFPVAIGQYTSNRLRVVEALYGVWRMGFWWLDEQVMATVTLALICFW
jgi:hypothetical protein